MKYSLEFKVDAVRLSNEIGVLRASQLLGIPYNTLSEWRKTRCKLELPVFDMNYGTYIRALEEENISLKKANAILQKAAFGA